ncbi:Major facilitator superfamily domain [Trinorchestia longiramus]|nr:Major facilitator superfamily domain [Trinorchestia longiramus]
MVVEDSSGGTPSLVDSHIGSSGRTRKYGTVLISSPFQDDNNIDKNTDKLSLSNEEIETSNNPVESASSLCDQTESIKSSPMGISFSLSYSEDTESLKSACPEVEEPSGLLVDNHIPTIKIVQSPSQVSSTDDVGNYVQGQNVTDKDRTSDCDGSFPTGSQQKFVPPDGGYGWVVVVASCMANVWIIGFLRSYSILYLRIMHEYGDSAYQASWIHALLTTTGFLLGPVTGLLCRKYGARSLGVGFVTTSGILIVNLYFDKHRGIACAICMSGNAIGAFLMPPLLQYLLQEYGLRGTLLIASALQLHILVSAFLFRPTNVHTRIQELDRKRALRSARDEAKLPLTVDQINKEKKWPKLTILQSVGSQKPSSRFTNLDPRRNEDKDSLTLELSSYRSMPLTASVPNLKEFRESLVDIPALRKEMEKTVNVEENKPNLQHIASADEFVRPARKRSSSECQFPLRSLDTSLEESPEAQLAHTKSDSSQGNDSRARKISLRRYVIDNSLSARSDGAAENLMEEKDPETINEIVSVNGPNHSLPMLKNSSEGSTIHKNGSLERPNALSCKSSPEIRKHTVKEDFKLFARAIGECFDMSVLKSKSMIIMGFSASMFSMGVPQALFYLHAFYTSVGMHTSEVTTLLSITAICDLCGRLSIGFIADTNYFRLSYLIAGSSMLASAGALNVPRTSTLMTAATAMGCYSFGVGSFIVLLPTILARNHGIDRLPATYGFTRLAMGLTTFIAPQVIGVLVDSTGSYLPTYYLMGTCMMLGSILLLFMPSPPSELSLTTS